MTLALATHLGGDDAGVWLPGVGRSVPGQVPGDQAPGPGQRDGPLDLFVGVLEAISEFAKIISFTFRLFGNIFAGQVLLFVMAAFLIPFLVFGTLIFYGLEVFVGLIQAVVFMMLTFVFIAMATAGHGAKSMASTRRKPFLRESRSRREPKISANLIPIIEEELMDPVSMRQLAAGLAIGLGAIGPGIGIGLLANGALRRLAATRKPPGRFRSI